MKTFFATLLTIAFLSSNSFCTDNLKPDERKTTTKCLSAINNVLTMSEEELLAVSDDFSGVKEKLLPTIFTKEDLKLISIYGKNIFDKIQENDLKNIPFKYELFPF
ncbi:hypothetical protein IM40_06520 [Candidatus Paracaedimonas acanthamoebae]|nr:hypothetical protein IM40_06520 [Candidatus Paracaedimonas acanthamoebae]